MAETELTEDEIQRLHRHGIRGQRYFAKLPGWLLKWATLILEYIEYEQTELPNYLHKHAISLGVPESQIKEEDLKIQAKCVVDARLHNMVITIDKVMRLLVQMKTKQAPLRVVGAEEIMSKFWDDSKGSLREQLVSIIELIQLAENSEAKPILGDILNSLREESLPHRKAADQIERFRLFRETIRDISYKLRKVDELLPSQLQSVTSSTKSVKRVFIRGLADTLFLTSFIESYFTRTQVYKKITSQKVSIRACDVNVNGSTNSELTVESARRIVYSNKKQYDASYIWGQLSGWFKQTVDKPNASLSAERRGTLSYPDLCSFVYEVRNPHFNRNVIKDEGGADEGDISSVDSKELVGRKRTARMKEDTSYLDEISESDSSDKQSKLGKKKRNMKAASQTGVYKSYPYGVSSKLSLLGQRDFSSKIRKQLLCNVACGQFMEFQEQVQVGLVNEVSLYGSVQFQSLVKARSIYEKEERSRYLEKVVEELRNF